MSGGVLADAINWTCQGVLLAAVAGGCSRMWRRGPAAARYRMWWATVAAILTMPAVSFWAGDAGVGQPATVVVAPIVHLPESDFFAAQIFLAAWAAWSVVALARLCGAVLTISRMKRRCTPFPRDRESRLTYWNAIRNSGRHARLALSPAVRSAAVLGGLSPVIAVSPALLRELEDDEVDRIVLHEWAHVQRRDDVAQFVQQIVQALAGFHPAVWWAVRQMQLERELACDEQVADTTGSARRYAACLTKLAAVVDLRGAAAAWPSALRRSQLTIRVLRLLERSSGRTPRPSVVWRVAGTAPLMLTLGVLVSVPIVGEMAPRIDAVVPSVTLPRLASAASDLPAAVARRADTPARAVGRPSNSSVPSPKFGDKLSGARMPRPENVSEFRTRDTGLVAPEPEMTRASIATVEANTHGLASAAQAVSVESQPNSPPVPVDRLPSGTVLAHLPGVTAPPTPPVQDVSQSTTPWSAAADAGIAIGRGSTKAAQSTAGFFTRMGKTIGGRF